MLKLFKFSQGWLDYYAAFEDLQQAYDLRADVDPTFHYTDVRIEEIKLEGHEIKVFPLNKKHPDAADTAELPFADEEEAQEDPSFTKIYDEIEAAEAEIVAVPKKRGRKPSEQ